MDNSQVQEEKLKPAIVSKLRPYFDNNLSANYTAMKTHMGRRTVQKYFQHWSNILLEDMDSDFIKMQREGKARGLLVLESIIAKIRETLDLMNKLNDSHIAKQQKLLKKDKTYEIKLNRWVIQTIARLTKDIFVMEQVKVMIQMKPTADMSLQLKIDELLSKVKPEDLQQLIKEAKEKEEK